MSTFPAFLTGGWLVYQGQTVDRTFTYYAADGVTPIDISNATEAYMVVRRDVKASDSIISLTTTPNSNGSRIYLGGALGTVRVLIDDEDTRNFPEVSGDFDIFLSYSDGTKEALVYGKFVITRRVSLR